MTSLGLENENKNNCYLELIMILLKRTVNVYLKMFSDIKINLCGMFVLLK